MHSTWVDNEHLRNTASQRIDSICKKQTGNRLQVISKINTMNDQNQIQINYPQSPQLQFLNQAYAQRSNKLSQGQVITNDGLTIDKDQRDKNLMKLMQEQLEFTKAIYEQKIKDQLKQHSSELSKLKFKIQDNYDLIQNKDKQIELLKNALSQSPVNLQCDRFTSSQSPNLSDKINDIEIRLAALTGNQEKLNRKIKDIGLKVEYVEKGLLRLFACKISKLQEKLNDYIDKSSLKLGNIELQTTNNIKKIIPANIQQPSISIQSLTHTIENIRNQVTTFKQKQFRYENSNIINLKRDISNMKHTISELQRKFNFTQVVFRNSKYSIKKHSDLQKKQNNPSTSCYFDDYEEIYQDVDTLGGEDQFFHPLEQSVKRFLQKDSSQPTHHQSKPTIHNDSFENFTSEDEDDDPPNIKRLLKTLKQRSVKLPLPIQIDLTGFIRKKNDQKYLLDSTKKGFMLTNVELNHCKERGLLIW